MLVAAGAGVLVNVAELDELEAVAVAVGGHLHFDVAGDLLGPARSRLAPFLSKSAWPFEIVRQ